MTTITVMTIKQMIATTISYIMWLYAFSYYAVHVGSVEYRFSTELWIEVPTQVLVGSIVLVIGAAIPIIIRKLIKD